MQLANVREHNLATLLGVLAAAETPLSRAELAQATSLTKPTVSRLVEDLLSAGLLTENTPARTGAGGRPGTPVALAAASVVGLGALVSADHVAVDLVDLRRQVVATASVPVTHPPTPRDAVVLLSDLTRELLTAHPHDAVAGLVVSVPGRLSPDGQRVRSAPNLGWDDAALGDLLRAAPGLAGIDVTLENDARLAAETEVVARSREGARDFVLVYGETGIGGAVVSGGEVLRGRHGWAGEIGHLCLDAEGPECRCGRRGCLEAYASHWALARESGHAGGIADFFESLAGAERHDVAERVGTRLGLALSQVLNIVDLPLVVLGGYFRELAAEITPFVAAELEARALAAEAGDLRVETAAGLAEPSLRGAGLRAIQPVFDDPAAWVRHSATRGG
ncbi:ROK family transcriptional regulator [Zhihengliuella sp.]|uniref:ROK family transcriptional regulator n=1 Tax=Zhihengliuella sp. TaxID=1954483 RepID=UPI002810F473|nr:ROK family transcriptional regulator [Zhihengliuella sp.]